MLSLGEHLWRVLHDGAGERIVATHVALDGTFRNVTAAELAAAARGACNAAASLRPSKPKSGFRGPLKGLLHPLNGDSNSGIVFCNAGGDGGEYVCFVGNIDQKPFLSLKSSGADPSPRIRSMVNEQSIMLGSGWRIHENKQSGVAPCPLIGKSFRDGSIACHRWFANVI